MSDPNLPPGCSMRDIDRAMGGDCADCETCDGAGMLDKSDCCQVNILSGDICSKCNEPCGNTNCSECDGAGVIDLVARKEAARQEARIERYEARRDEERDSQQTTTGQ